jgi:hypothetical protein
VHRCNTCGNRKIPDHHLPASEDALLDETGGKKSLYDVAVCCAMSPQESKLEDVTKSEFDSLRVERGRCFQLCLEEEELFEK